MFSIRLDGKVIASVDEQVTALRVQTARGEASVLGISDEGVVDIILDKVAPGGPVRLDQLEAFQAQQIRERGREGVLVGQPRHEVVAPAQGQLAKQGLHLETLRPGGVDPKEVGSTVHDHPLRDLAVGLDTGDVETRTARIEAFAKDGDYDKAIKDNPPGSGGAKTETKTETKPPVKGPTPVKV